MDWGERRGTRGKITHGTNTFYPKDDDAASAAAAEAERHSTGRRSRRECTAETIVDAASLIAVAATRMSVSDTLRWPSADRVSQFKPPVLFPICSTLGGVHAVHGLSDPYVLCLQYPCRPLFRHVFTTDSNDKAR